MKVLTQSDFERAAAALSCEVRAIKAVCEVEAPKGGFLPDGRPTILFERHQFSKRTARRFDAAHPDISSVKPGGYLGGLPEHGRLERAAKLDRDAALMSASWGKFQIMGFNHAAAGHPTLQGFINAMHESEGAQLDAFVAFIKDSPGLSRAIRALDWPTFARLYNGENYRINQYDTRLAAAYGRMA